MRTRLIILLFVMLGIPIAGLGWMGISTFKNEQELVKHRRDTLLLERLSDIDGTLSKLVQSYERRLSDAVRTMPTEAQEIRRWVRQDRLTRQLFRLDGEGRLSFPAGDDMSADEKAFLLRTHRIWSNGELFRRPSETRDKIRAQEPPDICNWFTWHFDEGLQLIYFCPQPDDGIAGAELDPVVVASDLIAELPQTRSPFKRIGEGSAFRIRLEDVDGKIFYQWGRYDPGETESPLVSMRLTPPLASFQLAYFSPPEASAVPFGGSVALGLLLGFISLVLVVVGLGVYFVRETSRDARTASQRMTFVNQVSHELKTPLTNLRMYAELLDEYLEEDDAQGRRYVNVIISESERLSRLIANVLSFARHTRGKLVIRPTPTIPDRTIRETVERFVPGFEQAGIETVLELNAKTERLLDGDALSQIVANLLSNVEKYASTGKWVQIESALQDDLLMVTVKDIGEGIPTGSEAAIFRPFVRLSNRLTDRAAGTGIGLSISRELARHHGGDLILIPSETGACFRVTLNAPPKSLDGVEK